MINDVSQFDYLHTQMRKKICTTLKLCVSVYTQSIHSTSIFVVHIVDVVHTVSYWQVLTGKMANLE